MEDSETISRERISAAVDVQEKSEARNFFSFLFTAPMIIYSRSFLLRRRFLLLLLLLRRFFSCRFDWMRFGVQLFNDCPVTRFVRLNELKNESSEEKETENRTRLLGTCTANPIESDGFANTRLSTVG